MDRNRALLGFKAISGSPSTYPPPRGSQHVHAWFLLPVPCTTDPYRREWRCGCGATRRHTYLAGRR